MKIIGQLTRSFGNFVTLRGVARMGDLEKISLADEGYQRELIGEHKDAMVEFLNKGEYTFYPELILSVTLAEKKTIKKNNDAKDEASNFYESVPHKNFKKTSFIGFSLKSTSQKINTKGDPRAPEKYCRGEFTPANSDDKILRRIDGNHRLSATWDANKEDELVPFCIIFFRPESEVEKYNRVLFNNINYKSIPLTQEQNLKLIFEEKEDGTFIFSDEELNDPVWFGQEYELARNLYKKISLSNLERLDAILKPLGKLGFFRTFLLGFVKLIVKDSTPDREVKNPNKALLNELLEQLPESFMKILGQEKPSEKLQKILDVIFPESLEEAFGEAFEEGFKEAFTEYFRQELPESLKETFKQEFPKKLEELIIEQWEKIEQEEIKIEYITFPRETFKEDWKRHQQTILKGEWNRIQQAAFKEVLQKKLPEALREVEGCYKKYPDKNQNYQLLIVHVYYYFHGKLNQFHNWVLENHIYELAVIDPQGIINIFGKVFETKKRTIFLATSFDEVAEQNTVAIGRAIDDINNNGLEKKLHLKFIRIDKTKKGYSIGITDEILKHLEQGGYMIADISLANPNVYYELGYQMGLNTGKGIPQNNFLLVHNEGVAGAEFDKDKSFNISHISIEKGENSDDLREKVKEQLKKYYRLDEK